MDQEQGELTDMQRKYRIMEVSLTPVDPSIKLKTWKRGRIVAFSLCQPLSLGLLPELLVLSMTSI